MVSHLKGLLNKRPELRVIISSATVDAQVINLFLLPLLPLANFLKIFKKYFGGKCPILQFPGRTYPVDIKYLKPDSPLLKIAGKSEDKQLGPFAGYFFQFRKLS